MPVRSWPEFDRDLARLAKRFRHVEDDVREALADPAADLRRVPRFGTALWKLRVRSRDQQSGKSGGFRLLAAPQAPPPPGAVVWWLLSIYAKADREDLEPRELIAVLKRFATWLDEADATGRSWPDLGSPPR